MMQTSSATDVRGTAVKVPARGVRWRVIASILGGAGWLIFFLLYVGFVPTGFTLFQSIVVVVASVVAITAILGAMWASYGMRHPELAHSSE